MSRSAIMINKVKIIFSFYKRFLMPSLVLNLVFIFFLIPPALGLIIKLSLALLVYLKLSTSVNKAKLIFYNNLSISNLQLFSFSFVLDAIIMFGFYLIYNLLI